jgi:hypothetical protein
MRNYISYYAEPVGKPSDGRAVLRCDIVVDGRLLQSYLVGTPAPAASVRAAEARYRLSS